MLVTIYKDQCCQRIKPYADMGQLVMMHTMSGMGRQKTAVHLLN